MYKVGMLQNNGSTHTPDEPDLLSCYDIIYLRDNDGKVMEFDDEESANKTAQKRQSNSKSEGPKMYSFESKGEGLFCEAAERLLLVLSIVKDIGEDKLEGVYGLSKNSVLTLARFIQQ